jgi:hypothetical protein
MKKEKVLFLFIYLKDAKYIEIYFKIEVQQGERGELWLYGPNIMKVRLKKKEEKKSIKSYFHVNIILSILSKN